MKELMFEEKGTWVKLNLNGIKHLWDSNELDYRKWPDQISKSYAIELLELSKIATSEKEKLEIFFHAKGICSKGRLYKELFRNMQWPYSKEELEYIENTKREADEFFNKGIVNF